MPLKKTKPFKHDYAAVLAKYPSSMPLEEIARREGIKPGTLKNFVWRLSRPRQRSPYRRGAAEVKRETLTALLDQLNVVRQQDLTGPEACGAITDIIMDALDAIGG